MMDNDGPQILDVIGNLMDQNPQEGFAKTEPNAAHRIHKCYTLRLNPEQPGFSTENDSGSEESMGLIPMDRPFSKGSPKVLPQPICQEQQHPVLQQTLLGLVL